MFIENMDGTKGFIVYEPRERIILICPDCGVPERVDKERWATQTFFNNQPPFCTGCGTMLQPVPEESEDVAY